jgi:hypothetical protein
VLAKSAVVSSAAEHLSITHSAFFFQASDRCQPAETVRLPRSGGVGHLEQSMPQGIPAEVLEFIAKNFLRAGTQRQF